MKKVGIILLAWLTILLFAACSKERSLETASNQTIETSREEPKKILNIKINGIAYQLELANNPTAKKLQNVLPNKFSMEDLHQNEKFYDLPESLLRNDVAVGEIEAGDVMLYGNRTLVIFYRSFETSYSYTRIGKILDSNELENVVGNSAVEIEIQKEDLP